MGGKTSLFEPGPSLTSATRCSSETSSATPRRAAMVDVLKAMALNSARASLVAARASWPAGVQPSADDQVRRIDVACSPYFR